MMTHKEVCKKIIEQHDKLYWIGVCLGIGVGSVVKYVEYKVVEKIFGKKTAIVFTVAEGMFMSVRERILRMNNISVDEFL